MRSNIIVRYQFGLMKGKSTTDVITRNEISHRKSKRIHSRSQNIICGVSTSLRMDQ